MKFTKRLMTLIGVMSLIMASMVTGHVSADEIETTLTVETSTPVCEDTVPSSMNIRDASRSFPAAGITPVNPPSTTPLRQSQSTNLDFRINTCLDGNQWNVYVSVSDFTSGDNVLASNGTIYIQGSRGVGAAQTQDFTLLTAMGTSGPFLAQSDAHRSLTPFASGWMPYTGSPFNTATGNHARPTGYTQAIQFGIRNVPADTAPGTYSATITATLIVTEP